SEGRSHQAFVRHDFAGVSGLRALAFLFDTLTLQYVGKRVIAFVTAEFVKRLIQEVERVLRQPGRRINRRTLDGVLVKQLLRADAGELLDDLRARREEECREDTRAILQVEVNGLHHQRLAFPVRYAIAEVRAEIRGLVPVRIGDDARAVVILFLQDEAIFR